MMEPAGLFSEALSNVFVFSFLFVFNAANWIKCAGASLVYFPLWSEPLAFFARCFQLPKRLIASFYSCSRERRDIPSQVKTTLQRSVQAVAQQEVYDGPWPQLKSIYDDDLLLNSVNFFYKTMTSHVGQSLVSMTKERKS